RARLRFRLHSRSLGEEEMKELLVFGEKEKIFRITIPDDAKVTFGPWSPPGDKSRGFESEGGKRGTLRIYGKTKEEVLAVFSGVTGFRDSSLKYAEQVLVQKGATLWQDDQNGYVSEQKSEGKREWITPSLTNGNGKSKVKVTKK